MPSNGLSSLVSVSHSTMPSVSPRSPLSLRLGATSLTSNAQVRGPTSSSGPRAKFRITESLGNVPSPSGAWSSSSFALCDGPSSSSSGPSFRFVYPDNPVWQITADVNVDRATGGLPRKSLKGRPRTCPTPRARIWKTRTPLLDGWSRLPVAVGISRPVCPSEKDGQSCRLGATQCCLSGACR